jgi:hypothetical protein
MQKPSASFGRPGAHDLQRHSPHMEGRPEPSGIAGGGPTASGAPSWPPLCGAHAYRLRSPCPSALRRARHGSGIRSSPAPREPCTARACASRLPSTAELFGRNIPVSRGWFRFLRRAPPPVRDIADDCLPALVHRDVLHANGLLASGSVTLERLDLCREGAGELIEGALRAVLLGGMLST